MKQLDRRKFLKIGGASITGLAVSGLDIPYLPWLSHKPALATALSDNAWTFGVMADTQWSSGNTAGGEPASCAVSIIEALNQQFIQHTCKFVIQVGDLADKEFVGTTRTMPTRAAASQTLYDAGIGFFPVRGNHEGSDIAANELPSLFPQTLGQGAHVFGAENFKSPPLESLQGLSYSFDYENVRCVLIDQFTRKDGSNYNGSLNNNTVDQVPWVEEVLSSKSSDKHAFVFAHKNLIGQNHKDVLFGGDLYANAGARDEFIQILDTNGVRYCLGGHDHMHHRSIVCDTNKQFNVDQIICSSNSYKFYIPKAGDGGREIPVVQELFTIGYYIFTIDGPRVTVDFYSSNHGQDYGDADLVTPPSSFTFYLRERFGYSLNGSRDVINHGDSYTKINTNEKFRPYKGSTARILSGINGNTETDYLKRELSKTVNTGWADADSVDNAASSIFSLWGMVDNLSLYDANLTGLLPSAKESTATDIYTLSLSYDPKKFRPSQLVSGKCVIASRGDDKVWVNAVDLNAAGVKKFVYGPWKAQYGLGTYGVDPRTSTAWAVLNQEGDFVLKLIKT